MVTVKENTWIYELAIKLQTFDYYSIFKSKVIEISFSNN